MKKMSKLSRALEAPEDSAVPDPGDQAEESAFLTSLWVMPMQLVCGPNCEWQGLSAFCDF